MAKIPTQGVRQGSDIGSAHWIYLAYEQAKEREKHQHGLFLNWAIKHYSTMTTTDGMFGWVDSMGKEVTVQEILDQYYNEK